MALTGACYDQLYCSSVLLAWGVLSPVSKVPRTAVGKDHQLAYGQFSLEGAIEMAWLMGYIRHFGGTIDGTPYSGWVDSKTKKPVADVDIKTVYEKRILTHSGIQLVQPDQFEDPRFLYEIILQEDLKPLHVRLLKGARLYIPRAMNSNRTVAGLIPSGWDPRTYGDPEDVVTQVDPVTLYTLVSTVEALLSSGITDPYELYQYIHVSEDVLQETFINTTGAWVNMLLLSAAGPLRTPVGACATAIESLELGYETNATGKAQFCLVGSCDVLIPETSREFANMKATVNTEEELARGRPPTRCLVRQPAPMGLPIRGIVAFVNTSSDKAGRSVPAPAREMALQNLDVEVSAVAAQDPTVNVDAYVHERRQQLLTDFTREESEARFKIGDNFWCNDPHIAPLSGALATWGLTINDLTAASFHDTSTVLNDKNESSVIQTQLRSLGHSKGAAGAWMLNGALQMLESGLVQGNRNADNIAYIQRPIRVGDLQAVCLTSFGFGKKGRRLSWFTRGICSLLWLKKTSRLTRIGVMSVRRSRYVFL
ncbi:hypothetical protein AN9245.2 [Aspergillus nidulans FGSC A4]|uniref:Fatty acid synthase, putative (JCVI) n=1 Tax=Emericella nidulans (strain FGSC A4 / ATCC 38163 / CBS 112.46 / NRRL 194 / M139) TaxID=227321 RepID=Q5AR35_EMENI|nr:hypothetical protein [Aspergillus nidulans FGSC A4]EAA66312.1 hypothetical protein AN9245.2 [Aspergillus nidulans FGSC A4]CBF87238.1 TPA: fatty acid synthase, putative (JCVI) [Aspergillus nidulans FGSC A4]|eukprot:XP_682514.1 hypothetical protein AN9245.2 [Aspergillus nidulans FGSC A4]